MKWILASLMVFAMIRSASSDQHSERTLAPPQGAPVIGAPSSGEEVYIKLPVTELKVLFPLWDGKQWRHQIYFQDGSWSGNWPMDVTVRFGKVTRDGESLQIAVIEMHERSHGRSHGNSSSSNWSGRRHTCLYSPKRQKIIDCDIQN